MKELELINAAKNGNISAKQQLLDDYFPVLKDKATTTYNLIVEAYKKYYRIDNKAFKLNASLLDISDVIDEFKVQYESLLDEYLSSKLIMDYQTFMTRGLYEFRNYYVKELTFSMDTKGEIISHGKLLNITELNPNYKKVLQSHGSSDTNKSVIEIPDYKEIIKKTIEELVEFLAKYSNLTEEQIKNDVYKGANDILKKLNLKDIGFYNNFVEQLQLFKMEYLQVCLGIKWEEKDVKPTMDLLMRKKLNTCEINQIPYYKRLMNEYIEATCNELSQIMSIDNFLITVEMENRILETAIDLFYSMEEFKISEFEINLIQSLTNIKKAYITSYILKTSMNPDESDSSPKKLF